jgi:hypothetical protein
MESTVDQAEKLLEKAESVHLFLRLIDRKLETLYYLAGQGKKKSQDRLDRLEYGSLWTRLFAEGNIGIAKHERDLLLLNVFQLLITTNLNEVTSLISQLTGFKEVMDDLQETSSSFQYSFSFPIEKQKRLLEESLNSLTQLKQKLIEKQQEHKNDLNERENSNRKKLFTSRKELEIE